MKDAKRTFITGRSGSGKSTLAKSMIRDCKRLVIFDPLDEYGRERHATKVDGIGDLTKAIKRHWSGAFRLAYTPRAMEMVALHALCERLMMFQKPYFEASGNPPIPKLTLLVEELNLSYPVQSISADLWAFGELCSRGRHYGIEVIGVSQRTAEVNTRFRGNCDQAYYFAQRNHTDLQTIGQEIGPRWKERLAGLQTHEYLRFSEGEVSEGKNILKS